MLDFSLHRDYDHKLDSASNLHERKPRVVLGYTPLHYAVIKGNENIIELLLSNGAKPNIVGCSPVHKLGKGMLIMLIKLLLNLESFSLITTDFSI